MIYAIIAWFRALMAPVSYRAAGFRSLELAAWAWAGDVVTEYALRSVDDESAERIAERAEEIEWAIGPREVPRISRSGATWAVPVATWRTFRRAAIEQRLCDGDDVTLIRS